MTESFPFVRITVLGSNGCGKTSLIHSFVNNSCPIYHVPTTFPTVVRLPPESDQKGAPTSVCVEIEDTVAPEVVEEEEPVYGEDGEQTKESKKATKLKNINFFFDMSRKNIVVPEGCTDFTPFSIWKAPRTPVTMERPVYIPLTQGRMAFIIVFDSNEQDSLDKACQIHRMLVDDLEQHKVRVRPFVYFVANKIEKDPESENFNMVLSMAERYTQSSFVRLMKVSSLHAKNVKRTFWDLLYLIIGNQVIWEIEYEHPEQVESEEEDKPQGEGCTQS